MIQLCLHPLECVSLYQQQRQQALSVKRKEGEGDSYLSLVLDTKETVSPSPFLAPDTKETERVPHPSLRLLPLISKSILHATRPRWTFFFSSESNLFWKVTKLGQYQGNLCINLSGRCLIDIRWT